MQNMLVIVAVSCGYDTWFAVRLWTIPFRILLGQFWDTLRIPHDQASPSQTHRCHIQPTGVYWLCFGSCFSGPLPLRSLLHGPLSRVHFGESLVVRLYSEIDHTYLSIEAQCVSHHYPRWTATLCTFCYVLLRMPLNVYPLPSFIIFFRRVCATTMSTNTLSEGLAHSTVHQHLRQLSVYLQSWALIFISKLSDVILLFTNKEFK